MIFRVSKWTLGLRYVVTWLLRVDPWSLVGYMLTLEVFIFLVFIMLVICLCLEMKGVCDF